MTKLPIRTPRDIPVNLTRHTRHARELSRVRRRRATDLGLAFLTGLVIVIGAVLFNTCTDSRSDLPAPVTTYNTVAPLTRQP